MPALRWGVSTRKRLCGRNKTKKTKNREKEKKKRKNSKTLILNNSSVRSIWTCLTASPCYSTNTETNIEETREKVLLKSIDVILYTFAEDTEFVFFSENVVRKHRRLDWLIDYSVSANSLTQSAFYRKNCVQPPLFCDSLLTLCDNMERISVNRFSFRRKGSWRNKEKNKEEQKEEFDMSSLTYISWVHPVSSCLSVSVWRTSRE